MTATVPLPPSHLGGRITALVQACRKSLSLAELPDETHTIYDIDPSHLMAAAGISNRLCTLLKQALACQRRSMVWRAQLAQQAAALPAQTAPQDPDHGVWVGYKQANSDYLEWHQMVIDSDELMTTRFRADVNAVWHDHQLFANFAYVLSLLSVRQQAERGEPVDALLTPQEAVLPLPPMRRLAVLDTLRDRAVCKLRVSELYSLLQSIGRQWDGLVYSEHLERLIERLAERADRLLVVHDTEERAHDMEAMRTLVKPATPGRPAVYAANRKLLTTVHWIFRDMFYHLALVAPYLVSRRYRSRERCRHAPTLEEYASAVEFFHRSSEILPHHDASDLMQTQLPTDAMMPGEYPLFYEQHPTAFRSSGTVIEARSQKNAVLDAAMELPQDVIRAELPRAAQVMECAKSARPFEALSPQSLKLRLALQAHLCLYMDTHYQSAMFADDYVFGQPRYASSLRIFQAEVNVPFMVQLFNHWQVVLNGELVHLDDFVAAFCVWLKMVRELHRGRLNDGQLDLGPLCREVLGH